MSRQDKALAVLALVAVFAAGAAYLRWRDRRFVEVARSIDPCDDEQDVRRKTASLGDPERDERPPEARVVSWSRNGRVRTVSFVMPRSGRLVVGTVTVAVDRRGDPSRDPQQDTVYEDTTGLRTCR